MCESECVFLAFCPEWDLDCHVGGWMQRCRPFTVRAAIASSTTDKRHPGSVAFVDYRCSVELVHTRRERASTASVACRLSERASECVDCCCASLLSVYGPCRMQMMAVCWQCIAVHHCTSVLYMPRWHNHTDATIGLYIAVVFAAHFAISMRWIS